jgi:DNA-binding FadR family transcriptional regulator
VNSPANKVRVPKAAELVASHLREQIIKSLIPEGENLPNEAEMVAEYNVSRPTLREAFRILESEGLISISRGSSGARVHLPRVEIVARHLGVLLQTRGVKLDDVYRARALVEPLAARLVAKRNDATDIKKLNAIIEHERSSLEDDGRFSVASNEFHHTLVEVSGVQTLSLLVEMLNEMLERHLLSLYLSNAHREDRIIARRKSIKAQQRLVGLLEQGKAQEAETFWHQHLEAVGAAIAKLQRIDQDIDISNL